ncbi:response regulator transcription factor [Bacillus pseudomycoides]|uniref:Response regulator transcription factor n=1 Tax=Bacillus bingmayongensis TaxID=1150157 RepID=A0ABU5JRG9_9BACI|nr:response regulator transcription factor [Bacillus pseudomycoides]
MIDLLLVDDHSVVGEGTKYLLEETGEIKVTYCISSLEALELIEAHNFDIYMLDLYMPGVNGLNLAKKIMQLDRNSKIIICTGFEISSLFNTFVESGILGCINKTATGMELITLIKAVLNGFTVLPLELYKQLRRTEPQGELDVCNDINNIVLTEREEKILIAISRGLKNREIANELLISQRSVEYSLTSIYKKLDANSRADALMKAEQHKLIHVQL